MKHVYISNVIIYCNDIYYTGNKTNMKYQSRDIQSDIYLFQIENSENYNTQTNEYKNIIYIYIECEALLKMYNEYTIFNCI